MRTELGKIDAQYEKLNAERADVEYMTPSTDDNVLATKLKELVGEGLRRCKEVGLVYLQAKINIRSATGSRDTAGTM